MRRVEVLAAARSLDGSDDALCRHSLPSRTLTLSPRPTIDISVYKRESRYVSCRYISAVFIFANLWGVGLMR